MAGELVTGIQMVRHDDDTYNFRTVSSAVIGLIGTAPDADAAEFPLNTPVLIPGHTRKAAKLGATGTLKDAIDMIFRFIPAMVVVVRVAEGADIDETLTNVVGDDTTKTGAFALLDAQAVLNVTPRLLIAPGFTSQRPSAASNPVVGALITIADRLRAFIFADGTNGTLADAVAWRNDFASERVMAMHNWPLVWDSELNQAVAKPPSAIAAGLQAKVDHERGFWWTMANQALGAAVRGVSKPVSFGTNDPNSETQYLNGNQITPIIHFRGYRFWGVQTTADSADPLWRFYNVVRTTDIVMETLKENILWAVFRPFSKENVLQIIESTNAFLRTLQASGAILGGRCWMESEINSKEQLADGHIQLTFDMEPPAPMEKITMHAYRNNEYYDAVLADIQAAITSQSA